MYVWLRICVTYMQTLRLVEGDKEYVRKLEQTKQLIAYELAFFIVDRLR